jgi:hypothetical protein
MRRVLVSHSCQLDLMLLLKIALAPLLIGVASLVGRRWGANAGGWFAALPLTSGPVLLAIVLERGPLFGAEACQGVLLALVSLAAFAIGYDAAARHRLPWAASGAVGCGAYLAIMWGVRGVALPLGWTFALVCVVLTAAIRILPAQPGVEPHARVAGRWALPFRMLLAALLVLTLTAIAGIVGPRMSGLLTPFPVVATILVASIHHADGAAAAGQFLRGLLAGLYSFALFFLIAGMTLLRLPTLPAFAAATAGALAAHGLLWCHVRQTHREAHD